MTEKVMKKLLANPTGIITSREITKMGLHRSILTQLVKQGVLYKIGRGVYMKKEAWEDEMYLLQYRYRKGIFSHETALYLHSMTDRTPMTFTMTFPKGYNSPSIKAENIRVHRVALDNYKLGITEILSSYGNPLRVYDLERTICDILRGKYPCDIQMVNQAMKEYTASKKKNVPRLMAYAEQLRVKPKVLNYMEILL